MPRNVDRRYRSTIRLTSLTPEPQNSSIYSLGFAAKELGPAEGPFDEVVAYRNTQSILKCCGLFAVDQAEVAVPANGNNVGEENPVLKGEEAKVDDLDEGPNHPVGLKGRPPGLLKACLRAGALHGGHAAQEDTDHDGSKGQLVTGHTGEDLHARVWQIDAASQEAEPGRGNGAKDACHTG